jgi:hypothetical protein
LNKKTGSNGDLSLFSYLHNVLTASLAVLLVANLLQPLKYSAGPLAEGCEPARVIVCEFWFTSAAIALPVKALAETSRESDRIIVSTLLILGRDYSQYSPYRGSSYIQFDDVHCEIQYVQ